MQKKFKSLKICIIGYGSIGRRHAQNLQKLGVENILIFRTGKAHPDAPNYDKKLNFFYNFEEVISQKPDAMFICNTTNLHSEYALKAVKNRCHVFIEKPIGNNLNHMEKIKYYLDNYKLISAVGYMMRFDPLVLQAKDIIENNKLGNITSAIFEWGTHLPSWHKWEDYSQSYAAKKDLGGGLILTCSHEIDLIRFLLGDIQKIMAYGGKKSYLNIEVEDHVDILSKHENGITSYLHLDWFQQPEHRTFKIIGDKGNINWNFHTNTLLINIDNKVQEKVAPLANWKLNDLYLDIVTDFLTSIVENKESKCSFNDGLLTLKDTIKILNKIKN